MLHKDSSLARDQKYIPHQGDWQDI